MKQHVHMIDAIQARMINESIIHGLPFVVFLPDFGCGIHKGLPLATMVHGRDTDFPYKQILLAFFCQTTVSVQHGSLVF